MSPYSQCKRFAGASGYKMSLEGDGAINSPLQKSDESVLACEMRTRARNRCLPFAH